MLRLTSACAITIGCDPADDEALLLAEEDAADEDAADKADLVHVDGAAPLAAKDPETAPEAPEALGDLAIAADDPSALQTMWSFKWYQGWAAQPIPMGSTSDRFCFLTEVRGRFKGAGESVRVYQANGSWWLSGSSQQIDVMGGALCIPRNYWGQTLTVSGEYGWGQGNNPVHLGSDTNRVCYLTRVSGDFEGGGERVEVYRSGGSWWLGGASQQAGVAAGARCVNSIYRNGPYTWAQGQAPRVMNNADEWACGLTKIQGRLEGGGERMVAYTSGNWWYLGGSSGQNSVATAAFCM